MIDLNIRRHDYCDVAERIAHRLKDHEYAGATAVLVSDNGNVRLKAARRLDAFPATHLVGTYTRGVPVEVIEGDLLCRMRELAA